MGLFKPYSRQDEPAAPEEPQPVHNPNKKKQGPTRTRAEAEAARRERLHPKLTPKQRRERESDVRRDERMQAMAAVENAPGRRIARRVVDSSRHLTEMLLPIMVVMLAVMYGMQYLAPALYLQMQFVVYIALYALIIAAMVDVWWTWRRVKRTIAAEAPGEPHRGLFFYTMNRQMMIRRFRQPPAEKKSPIS